MSEKWDEEEGEVFYSDEEFLASLEHPDAQRVTHHADAASTVTEEPEEPSAK